MSVLSEPLPGPSPAATAREWDGARGWRWPVLAALIAMLAGLPGVFGLPPLDRDESRFAQATAQMLETGDFVNIEFQDDPRHKKPVGIHWLQAASVAVVSSPEARDIRAYRIPSLLGAMLAAAACAWGAAPFFGRRGGFVAGAVLGATFLLSTEASIAKTDAVLCGAVVLTQAALARLYGAARGIGTAGNGTRTLMWVGLALAILIKGPIGPMVFALTLAALWIADREGRWIRKLGWTWGLALIALIVGPWAVAITVATDGAFWGSAIGGDLAPKLAGADERHGGLPGYHLAVLPLAAFPATLLIPAALAAGWALRREPGVRFALAWLIPAWLVFELSPTKLPHYPLPLYGALAWLVAAALSRPVPAAARLSGAVLAVLAAVALAAGTVYLLSEYGDATDTTLAAFTVGLFAAAGLAGAVLLVRDAPRAALASASVLGVLAHGFLAEGLLPRLEPLRLTPRAAEALAVLNLDPRRGLQPGPVEVAGFAEPSLVFLLGTQTGLGDAPEAAQAVQEGRPAIVAGEHQAAFARELARRGAQAEAVATVDGFNYSNGDETRLTLYRRKEAP
jgi:4-amino-4-deoxy-L-arabinose transferase-like glycosyltransferase